MATGRPFIDSNRIRAGSVWAGVVVLCLLSLHVLTGHAQDKKVNLRGSWRFSLGDNMKYAAPNYDDSGWEKIYVPSAWQKEGFRNYRGYAWYRKKFTLTAGKDEVLVLHLGRIDDTDAVYVNGHLIGTMGGFPPDYFTAYNLQRSYVIPPQYVNAGHDNVVAVRVFDHGGEGGIIGGRESLGIYSYGIEARDIYMLDGNWKFRLFDDLRWAEMQTDDSGWENVAAPSTWEDQGFRDYDGFAWYRKRFTLPAGYNTDDMVVLLGKIDDLDEVYINGKRVGYTGNMETKLVNHQEYDQSRTYFLPDGLLRAGQENVIAVRVYDLTSRGGIYQGPVAILPRNQYKNFRKRYESEEDTPWGYWDLFSLFD